MSTTKSKEVTMTPRDFEILANALKCSKTEITIDYEKLATRCNFKNSASAKASWHSLKKKLDKMEIGSKIESTITVTDPPTPGPATGKGTKGGKKRKAAAEESEEDDDDEEDKEASPSPPPKKPAAKKSRTAGRSKMPAKSTGAKKAAAPKKAAAKKEAAVKQDESTDEGDEDEDGEEYEQPAGKLVDAMEGEGEEGAGDE